MTFSKSIVRSIQTTDTKKPGSPQITIPNPLDDDTFINGIELILSPEFSKKGKLLIEINDIDEFDSKDSQSFDGYAKFPIQLAKKFKQGHDIRIFAWNGSDSNTIKMSLNLSISKFPEPFNSQAVPLGKDVFNTVLSDDVILFPQRNYADETVTQLLNMEGYKNLLLKIASAQSVLPTVVQSLHSDAEVAVDGDINSSTGIVGITTVNSAPIIVDFGFAATRGLAVKYTDHHNAGTRTATTRLFYSNNLVDYVEVGSLAHENTEISEEFIGTIDGGQHFFRYAALNRICNVGGLSGSIFEIYDSNILGGSASLSFESLDIASGQWIEVIKASEIGTISFGLAVLREVGKDIQTDVPNNMFNHFLPSTQTGFRAKLVVTGKLNTGVSVSRVA